MPFRTVIWVILLATVVGCQREPASPGDGPSRRPASGVTAPTVPVPSSEEWSQEDSDRVLLVCGACHATPPVSALPAAEWRDVVLSMGKVPVPEGLEAMSAEDLALAVAYYERNAPEALEELPQLAQESGPLRFEVEHFTPKGLENERIPAVANVAFVNLSDARRSDVLVCEMRSRTLMIQSLWGPKPVRQLRPLAGNLNYPVHSQLIDMDADGRLDIVIASIGGMNPGNDTRGSVALLLQDERQRFGRTIVAKNLGRPADARAADLDGDGDLDLAVTAFGWRGPGELQVLENRGGSPPSFQPHVLDERDGFIHAEAVDLDGDGLLELVAVLSQEHEEVVVYENGGGLTFTAETVFRAPHPSWGFSGLQLVDMDGDGDQDVLVSNGDTLDDDVLKPYHGVSWLENRGALDFVEHRIVFLYGCERAVAHDVDGDGDVDVVAVSFLPQIPPDVWRRRNLDSVIWVERQEDGWQPHSIEKHACYHPTVDVADYDRDGRTDIVVGNYIWLGVDGQPMVRADYTTVFSGR